jgi:hypothetical protein
MLGCGRLVRPALVAAFVASLPAVVQAEEPQRPLPGTYAEVPESPRPPPLDQDLELPQLKKEHRVDISTQALLVTRLAETEIDGKETGIAYDPAPGVGATLRVIVHDYFQVGAGWNWATHTLTMEKGALGLDGDIEMDSVTSYSLAVHFMPTLPIGDRVRLWASAGIGWGRHYYPPMYVKDASGSFVVRDRAASFVDFPLGIGGMVELMPNWISLDLDITVAPGLPENGSAAIDITTLDGAGRRRTVGPIPGAMVTFVQALGLSVLL